MTAQVHESRRLARASVLENLLTALLFVGLCVVVDSAGHNGMDIDSVRYVALAESLYRGEGFVTENALGEMVPDATRTPILPGILAGLRTVFEGGALLAAFLWLQRMAWLGAVLWAISLSYSPEGLAAPKWRLREARAILLFLPMVIFNGSLVLTDLLFAAGILVWSRLLGRYFESLRLGLAAGLFAGILTLLRPLGLLFPLAAGIPFLFYRKTRNAAIVMMLASLILPGLWTTRNYIQAGAPTLSALTGRGLALHRNEAIAREGRLWAETSDELIFVEQMEKTINPFDGVWVLETKSGLTGPEGDTVARSMALRAIAHDPWAYLGKGVRNATQYFWTGGELADMMSWSSKEFSATSPGYYYAVWIARIVNALALVALPGYFLVRSWQGIRGNPVALGCLLGALYLVIFPALTTVTYSRFALPVLPALAMLVAGVWEKRGGNGEFAATPRPH